MSNNPPHIQWENMSRIAEGVFPFSPMRHAFSGSKKSKEPARDDTPIPSIVWDAENRIRCFG